MPWGPAALDLEDETAGARGARIERMGGTLLAPDTPARGRGTGGPGLRMGDEKTGRAPGCSRQTQAPGWCQPDLVEHTGDKGHTARFQTFFKRQSRLARTRGFNHDETGGIEPEMCKTGGGRASQLCRHNLGPAPEHERLGASLPGLGL